MKFSAQPLRRSTPALARLAALAPLDEADLAVLASATDMPRSVPARRDMTASLADLSAPVLILEGWAHCSVLMADGRRQIIDFLLPGDLLLGPSLAGGSDASVTAITSVTYCPLPASAIAARPALTEVLEASRALEERRLRRHIVRLGRLDALERITDWLLELHERLEASGTSTGDTMPLPVTQEIMADSLGLTSVHVNRMLGALHRENLLNIQSGRATFLDRASCRSMVGRR